MIPQQMARKQHDSASKLVGEVTEHMRRAFSLDELDTRSRLLAAMPNIILDSGLLQIEG